MTTKYPCQVKTCENYGERCFRHCNHCSKEVRWRPSLLDKEIAYSGPKPLNMDDTVHHCMLDGTKDGKYYFTGKQDHINNVPEYVKKHYRSLIDNGKCIIENCFCIEIEKMKNPDILEKSNKKRAEWLKHWEGEIGGEKHIGI